MNTIKTTRIYIEIDSESYFEDLEMPLKNKGEIGFIVQWNRCEERTIRDLIAIERRSVFITLKKIML